jgi:hypothetical protein
MRAQYLVVLVAGGVLALGVGFGCSTSPDDAAGTAGSAGASGSGMSCTSVSACGGAVVGTWNVTSSCLKLSGDMDVSLLSLACPTVPITGSLATTGTFVAHADGTYTDDTRTTGSATFPIDASCLSISSVPVTCEKAGSVFSALGWTTTSCVETSGKCQCTLEVDQAGGIGLVSGLVTRQGPYSTAGNKLTTSDVNYSYCAAGNTLTITPETSSLSGSVVLTRAGDGGGQGGSGNAAGSGSGGSGMAGSPPAGGATTGGAMTGGSGGVAGGSGGSGGLGGSGGGGGSGGSGGSGTVALPCDIYAAQDASTKCVAAHSTIRSLFRAYSGPLYQVKRASDGMTKDIPVLAPGGFADSGQQDTFCAQTTCTILKIYDQSGMGNFLEAETPDSMVGGHSGMTAASATKESLTVGGHKVYSLYTNPSQAYWRDGSKSGMPLGAAPQGVYIVTSGKHFNGGCCYDYGNGETSRTYVPGNSMDALYFGNSTTWGSGNGNGPWVMADLEGGVFSGPSTAKNNALLSHTSTYVTAIEKNNGTSKLALKAADATTGTLTTYYDGNLPPGKGPGQKQGSIVLGSGGDCCYSNNNASQGTFYEGAIVAGYPSDATDAAIQSNIVSTGYGK